MEIRKMVSPSEVARELGLAGSTIRQYAREGRIPVALKTPGGHARFVMDEVKDALAATVGRREEVSTLFENKTIERRTFAPVGIGDGDVIVNMAALPLQLAEEWQVAFGIAAASVITGDSEDGVDPVVGVRGTGRFAVDRALLPA